MGINICQACGCCNHCDSRHIEGIGPDEAHCPFDPETTEAEIRASLEAHGISKEKQEESFKTVTHLIELSMAKERLTNELTNLRTFIDELVTRQCGCEVWGNDDHKCDPCRAKAMLSLEEEDGEWWHCSPDLLKEGIDCATTPRRPCPCPNGSHDHFIVKEKDSD